MGLVQDPYSDPEFILALYGDPANEVLLAEYLLATGGLQLGFGSPASGGTNASLQVTEIQGTGGEGGGHGPCFVGLTPVTMADGIERPIREVLPHQFNLGFDNRGNLLASKISKVFIHGVTECLIAKFADGRETGVNAIHRYWQGGDKFTRLDRIKYSLALKEGEWSRTKVASVEIFSPGTAFLLYNFETETGTYIANKDGVHNAKPQSGNEF